MKHWGAMFALFAFAGMGAAQSLNCNMQDYKSVDGIKVDASADSVAFTWDGETGSQLRASFGLRDGQPVVKELSARKGDGAWIPLGKDLIPQFEVTTGRRRIDSVEMANLKKYNLDTPENEEMYKWNVFWDAPLAIPGTQRMSGPPRQASEIGRAAVSYKSDSCKVASDGDRVSVTFNGLSLGIFAGELQFTVYKGSNLLRQEALAKTDAPSVAYIYKAGLKRFQTSQTTPR